MAQDLYPGGSARRRRAPLAHPAALLNQKVLLESFRSMREEVMSAIAKNDPSKINSAFIISHFCEEHFKEMMDAYLSKVLVCGKAPKDP